MEGAGAAGGVCVPDGAAGFQVSADGTYFCVFPNAVLHRGATLTVNATANGDAFKHELAFENAGDASRDAGPGRTARSAGPGAHGAECIARGARPGR